MKEIEVEITGTSPLLMNSPAGMDLGKTKKILKDYNPQDEAEKAAYWRTDWRDTPSKDLKGKETRELVIPSNVLFGCLMKASTGYKIGRKTASGLLAGVVKVDPFEISLGTDKYEIDTRPVNIRGSGKVPRSRALVKEWKATFKFIYNEQYLPPTEADNLLREILEAGGVRCGIMDYSPRCKGQYGCFKITKWSPQ